MSTTPDDAAMPAPQGTRAAVPTPRLGGFAGRIRIAPDFDAWPADIAAQPGVEPSPAPTDSPEPR